jgi:hypothetical protein
MAQDGNGVIIAVQGPDDSLDFYWQIIGESSWQKEIVAGNGTTFSAPSLANIGGGVGIVAEGPDNSLRYYWAANGTPDWQEENVAGPGTTYSAPSIAGNDDMANVVAQGPDHSLDFYWQQDGTTPWNPETVFGGSIAYSVPVVTGNDGYVNIVVQGPDNSLFFLWQQDGATQWNVSTPKGSTDAGQPSNATFSGSAGDGVYVAAISVQDIPGVYTDINGSGTWQGRGVQGSSGFAAGSNATVTANDGVANVAVYQYNGELDFFWQNSTGAFVQEVVAAPGVN